jgi:hypothetical protein
MVLQCGAGSCWTIGVKPCQFWPAVGQEFGMLLASQSRIHGIDSHETKGDASRPLKMSLMVLINGVAMWCWLLLAQWCQAMPIFGLQLAESLAFCYIANQSQIDGIDCCETK